MRTQSNAAADVNALHTRLPSGVQMAFVVEFVGAVPFVTVAPSAVYPVPEPFVTSFVALYAVVAAPIEAFVTYNAAFRTSTVVTVRVAFALCVPSAWEPLRHSILNEEHIAVALADIEIGRAHV